MVMSNIPTVTKNLLIINVLAYLASAVALRYGIALDQFLGLHFFMSPNFHFFQLVTYMFMHANVSHIFFNMFALWMFGCALERAWGARNFLIYYMVCGIGAGMLQEIATGVEYYFVAASLSQEGINEVMLNGADVLNQMMNYTNSGLANLNLILNSSTVGASGAVYGILLGYGVMYPNQLMYIFPFPFPIKTKYMVVGYAAIELVLALANSQSDHVAHVAHLGGMLFGLLLIMYWKRKMRKNGYYYY